MPAIPSHPRPAEYSPLRYPGGKAWFLPRLRAWLSALPHRPELFIEPFAGGGSASLAVAAENLATRVLMVEKNSEVAALWRIVLRGRAEKLVGRVLEFRATPEAIDTALAGTPSDELDTAVRLLLRNRVGRDRYLNTAGPLKLRRDRSGEIYWRPGPLAAKLRTVAGLASRIEFIEGDAVAVLPDYVARDDCALFVDPPYCVGSNASHRHYYRHGELDHGALFALMAQGLAPFLMIYDDTPEIRALAAGCGFCSEALPRKRGNSLAELLITRC